MRFVLIIALALLSGGFLGSSAYVAGDGANHFSEAGVTAMGESLAVIIAILLPALILLALAMLDGARRLTR